MGLFKNFTSIIFCRAAGAFRKGGPQTEVGSTLSSDTYTYYYYYYSSELVIIEALDGLGALGLGT